MKSPRRWAFLWGVIVLSGCSPSMETPATVATGIKKSGNLNRAARVDIAIALWYAEQAGAESLIHDLTDVQIGPIWNRRKPQEILRVMRVAIVSVEKHPSSDEKVKQAIAGWRESQVKAANGLRAMVGKPAIPEPPPMDSRTLLDLQKADLDVLGRERGWIGMK